MTKHKLEHFLAAVPLWAAAAVAAIAAVIMIVFTADFAASEPADAILITHSWDDALRSVLVAIAIVAVLGFVLKLVSRLRARTLVVIVAIALLAMQLYWITGLNCNDSYIYRDSRSLDALAQGLVTGNMSVFNETLPGDWHPYLQTYPFQSGTVLVLAAVYRLFGVGNEFAFQVVNCFANCASFLLLNGVVARLFEQDNVQRAHALFSAICLPLIFSPAFVYGNVIAFALFCGALYCCVRSLSSGEHGRKTELRWLLLSFVFLAMALIAKTTILLLMLPMALVWFLALFFRKHWQSAIGLIVCALLCLNVGNVTRTVLEDASGITFGSGMPQIQWIEMGLADNPAAYAPGWWTPDTYFVWQDSGFDSASVAAQSRANVLARVAELAGDPGQAISFFGGKLSAEWSDPYFQSLYYSKLSNADLQFDVVQSRVIANDSFAHVFLRSFADGYALAVMALSCGAFVSLAKARNRRLSDALVPLVIVAGFCCYLVWETKPVYLLPFFLLSVPYAAFGLEQLETRLINPNRANANATQHPQLVRSSSAYSSSSDSNAASLGV